MGDYGFRIAQTGKDVKTCSDLETVITSKYAVLKGAISGTGYVTINGTQVKTVTIAHNLGYVPFHQVRTQSIGRGSTYGATPDYSGVSSLTYLTITSSADTTNLYITYDYNDEFETGNQTMYYKYFIYKDKGKL